MDCGPTCLRMVAKHYRRAFCIQKLREATENGKAGVSLLVISEAAESIGFKTLVVKVPDIFFPLTNIFQRRSYKIKFLFL